MGQQVMDKLNVLNVVVVHKGWTPPDYLQEAADAFLAAYVEALRARGIASGDLKMEGILRGGEFEITIQAGPRDAPRGTSR